MSYTKWCGAAAFVAATTLIIFPFAQIQWFFLWMCKAFDLVAYHVERYTASICENEFAFLGQQVPTACSSVILCNYCYVCMVHLGYDH